MFASTIPRHDDTNALDYNIGIVAKHIATHNDSPDAKRVDVLNRRHRLFAIDEGIATEAGSKPVARKRLVKGRLYNNLPLWLGPLAYFLFRYVIQLGFLDGREGLIYHFLQGFWCRSLVHAKVIELERALTDLHVSAEKREALQRLTELKLNGSPS